MKTASSIAAFTGLLSAVSAQYFNVMTVRSGSPIQYAEVQARGFGLYLNGPAGTYCPENIAAINDCPAGNTTTFAGGNGTLGMGTEVPGGQQVFIRGCTGEISYTQAHSASLPEDAILDGWAVSVEEPFGHLTWKNGLIACPTTHDPNTTYGYQVFAQVANVTFGESCLGFDGITVGETQPGAWQYE